MAATKKVRFAMLAIGAAALCVVGLIARPALAQGWQGEWEALKRTAAQEGGVVCACPRHPATRDALISAWNKDFPGVKLEYTPSNTPTWQRRIETEREGGKYLWDTYFSGAGPDTFRLARNGVFDPVVPYLFRPDVADPAIWGGWDDVFLDKANKYMFSFWYTLSSAYYNAKLVPPDEVAKRGLEIMLDPKYKGKAVWRDPRVGGSGNAFLTFFYTAHGPEKTRQLIGDQAPVFVRNENEVGKRMVQGSAVFALATYPDFIKPYTEAGVDIDLRPIGNTPRDAQANSGYGIFAIINRPAHPSSAKLFANWILSKDVQAVLAKVAERDSRRSNLPPVNTDVPRLPGAKYIHSQKEENLAMRRAATDLAKQVRPN